MLYIDNSTSGTGVYPDLAQKNKDAAWFLQYARAAWRDFGRLSDGFLYGGSDRYYLNRQYAMGNQPVSQYMKLLGVAEEADKTWLSIDETVRPIISTYRDMAISRILKSDYEVVATPVDSLAKSQMQDEINRLKTRIMLRQMAQESGDEEMINHPLLKAAPGEPYDLEELEARLQFGEQFIRSMDAELAISLGMQRNTYPKLREQWVQDLFDYGVAGYFDELCEGQPKITRANPETLVVSYCEEPDFSDMVHGGAVINVKLTELATITDERGNPIFTDNELQELASKCAGKWGNPVYYASNGYQEFVCQVLKLYMYGYENRSYLDASDDNGNQKWRYMEDAKSGEKYVSKRVQYVYKTFWVIGTEKVYKYGKEDYQKRLADPKRRGEARLPLKLVAYNFNKMRAQAIMDRARPYLDDYQLTVLKIQNWKNQHVPSGWAFDLDALENVALSKGGEAMQPMDLIDMFFEKGVIAGRSLGPDGKQLTSSGFMPIVAISNSAAGELQVYYNDLIFNMQAIEKMTGYNSITSGTPNPKTLVPGYELANESTEDALAPMARAEAALTISMAKDILCRTQQALKEGDVEGYADALNKNTIEFIRISPKIIDRDYGIILNRRTTQEQRMLLLQSVQQDIANGFLDGGDAMTVVETHNFKQARVILSEKVRRAKQEAHKREMEKIQLNNQGAQEAAQIAQQQRMMELQIATQAELQKEQMKLQFELELKKLEYASKESMNIRDNETKLMEAGSQESGRVQSALVQAEAKKKSAEIAAAASLKKNSEKSE